MLFFGLFCYFSVFFPLSSLKNFLPTPLAGYTEFVHLKAFSPDQNLILDQLNFGAEYLQIR